MKACAYLCRKCLLIDGFGEFGKYDDTTRCVRDIHRLQQLIFYLALMNKHTTGILSYMLQKNLQKLKPAEKGKRH